MASVASVAYDVHMSHGDDNGNLTILAAAALVNFAQTALEFRCAQARPREPRAAAIAAADEHMDVEARQSDVSCNPGGRPSSPVVTGGSRRAGPARAAARETAPLGAAAAAAASPRGRGPPGRRGLRPAPLAAVPSFALLANDADVDDEAPRPVGATPRTVSMTYLRWAEHFAALDEDDERPAALYCPQDQLERGQISAGGVSRGRPLLGQQHLLDARDDLLRLLDRRISTQRKRLGSSSPRSGLRSKVDKLVRRRVHLRMSV